MAKILSIAGARVGYVIALMLTVLLYAIAA